MYVANRASDKITQLTDNVYVCRSGSVSIHAILNIEAKKKIVMIFSSFHVKMLEYKLLFSH